MAVFRTCAISSAGAATALLALALLGAQVRAQTGAVAGTVEEPTYIPTGVSDAGGDVGCFRTPEGGVEAVDLATGRSLWRSAAPARAMLVARGRRSFSKSVPDSPCGLESRPLHAPSAWARLPCAATIGT